MIYKCGSCMQVKANTKSAVVNDVYYPHICSNCLGQAEDTISGGAASYDRRRGYEDNAQDTIQPYDANGQPRSEFYRLYPGAAEKVFSPEVIEQLKRKI